MNFIEKAPWKLCSLTYLVLALPIDAADPKNLFAYDHKLPFDIREAGVEERNGVKIHDISYANRPVLIPGSLTRRSKRFQEGD